MAQPNPCSPTPRPRALVAALIGLALLAVPGLGVAGPFRAEQLHHARAREALATYGDDVKAAFDRAGAAWPPRGLLLVAYKLEGELEVHAPVAKGDRWVRVETIPICAASGVLGPKAYEGDLQVPEGFYQIDKLNPHSQFHLSLHVNYPNRADRLRNPEEPRLGNAIMVHGNCVTIGCLPLEDGPISHLYTAMVFARDAGVRDLPLHIHPCRHDKVRCVAAKKKAAAEQPYLAEFWAELEVGYAALRDEGRPPKMVPTPEGGYRRAP